MITPQQNREDERAAKRKLVHRRLTVAAITGLLCILCLAAVGLNQPLEQPGNSTAVAAAESEVKSDAKADAKVDAKVDATTDAKTDAKDDAKGDELLKKSCAFYKGLKSFSFSLQCGLSEGGTENAAKTSNFDMSFARPNKASMRMLNGMLGCSAFSDGKTVTYLSTKENKYASMPAPEQLAQIMQTADYLTLDRGLTMLSLLHTLLAEDPYENIMHGQPVKVTYAGTEKINGEECDHLKFTKQVNWDVFVRKTGDPWVQQVSIDITNLREKGGVAGSNKYAVISTYSKQSAAEIKDNKFAYAPPKDAQQVKTFASPGSSAPGEHPLSGKQAPNFTVNTLDGKQFELAKNKGQVVVLDFWATWCPPCRMGLPIVTEVTKSFADKGVVFLAVDSGEDPKNIQEFLDTTKISLNVGLDRDAAVAMMYQVQGIPQTVIIGKDGKIAKIDVGFSPDLKEDLTKTISALVSN